MVLFHHYIADNANPSSLASRMRRRRFALFRQLLTEPTPARSLLDVGGTPGFWSSMDGAFEGLSITLLNQKPNAETLPPGFRAVTGDARAMSAFADREFDVVFSNSVIEHVGSFEDQRRMADEVRRVGRRYFVQTPNRYFPIEPHFLLPYFQFYPEALQVELTRRYALGWYERIPELERARAHVRSHRLLSSAEMHALFPEARIHAERIAVLTKSLIAIGGSG